MTVVAVALSSLVVAVIATPLAMRVAIARDIVDRPGPAKVQTEPVPYLGGVAVMAAITLPIALTRPLVLVPAGLALVLGLTDDATDLPPRVRLAAEFCIGAVVAWLFPTALPAPFGPVAVVLVVVTLMNAVNVIDGLDALAGSVVAIAAVGFAIVLGGPIELVAVALAGALLGFLVFNRPPARIYLGDAGSYLLGCLLAVLVASAWAPGEAVAVGVASLLLVVVPVTDLAVSATRRLVHRRPMFASDRGHIYDQLVDRSWPPTRATLAFAVTQSVIVVVAVVVAAVDPTAAVAIVGATVAVLVAAVLAGGFLADGPDTRSPDAGAS